MRARHVRRYYGWRIVGVLAVTEPVSWGVLYYAFTVLLVPMREDLELSTATLTGAFSLSVLLTGLAAVPVGRWLDVHGPRALMTAGSVTAVVLVVAWSRVDSIAALYVVFAAIGLVRAAVLYEPAFAVVVRWFEASRATALLVVTVAGGFASTIFMPVTAVLVDGLGWRKALLVLAAVLGALTVLPHWIVLRRDPGDLGLRPDGDASAAGLPRPAGPVRRPVRLRETARWAVRDATYRWFALAFAANSLAIIVVAVHLVPYLTEQGHSPTFAAVAAGSLGALSVTGRLLLTAASRRVPTLRVTAAMFGVQALAVLVLMVSGAAAAGAVVFVVLFGLGFGVATIARPALLAETYGTDRYATLSGLLAVAVMTANTIGPAASGIARTATGGYTGVLVAVLVLCAVAGAALLRAGAAASSSTSEGALRAVHT